MRALPFLALAVLGVAGAVIWGAAFSDGSVASHTAAITAKAKAYDGDGLYLYPSGPRVKIRLWGIDAPELGTLAGEASFAALAQRVDGQTVTCQPPPDEADYPLSGNRKVARCELDGDDLARGQVEANHAEDWPLFSKGYYAR